MIYLVCHGLWSYSPFTKFGISWFFILKFIFLVSFIKRNHQEFVGSPHFSHSFFLISYTTIRKIKAEKKKLWAYFGGNISSFGVNSNNREPEWIAGIGGHQGAFGDHSFHRRRSWRKRDLNLEGKIEAPMVIEKNRCIYNYSC